MSKTTSPDSESSTQSMKHPPKRIHVCRVLPCYQNRLLYAEHYVASELRKLGHLTTFVSTDQVDPTLIKIVPPQPAGVYRENQSALLRVPAKIFAGKAFVFAKSFQRILRSPKYDVYHLMGVGTPLTMSFLRAYKKNRNTQPIVIQDHSSSQTSTRNDWRQPLYYGAMRTLLSRSKNLVSKVHTFSSESARLLQDRFDMPASKFVIFPLGFDSSVFNYQPRESRNPAEFHVGFAGKVDPAKRLERLITVLGQIDHAGLTCHLAGLDDAAPSLNQALVELAQANKVKLKSYPLLNRVQLAEFYNQMDLAVFPGSISITTLEASGCGAPILLYRSIPKLEGRVANGRGYLFENDQELEQQIRGFISERELESQRTLRAETSANELGWQKIALQYLDLYAELLGEQTV